MWTKMNLFNKARWLQRWVSFADITFSDAFSKAARGKHQYIRRFPRANANSIYAAIMFNASRFCNIQTFRSPSSSITAVNENLISEKNDLATNLSYEKAVCCLNGLLSNAAVLRSLPEFRQANNVKDTIKYLQRSGLTLEEIDSIPIIHVSGTKGKGSTCALTESILRSFGVHTGFFSSPHLISVTERIRINGKPISTDDFTETFWKVYERLDKNKEHERDMPPYFKFLTVLCFHIFLKHRVEVGIMEVGIGGELDCTNFLRNVKTVGITSLGLEHTQILGNTIEEIAWQKAGIIKPHSNVFITPQPNECLEVIKKRALEKNAKVFIAPEFTAYNWSRTPNLKFNSDAPYLNASLAIQLACDWLRNYKVKQLNGFAEQLNLNSGIILDIPEGIIRGLEGWFWPGRNQKVDFHNMTIYLDGAHTIESLNICVKWFLDSTRNSKNMKFFIFNVTGDRDSKKLLGILHKHKSIFTEALFVPNIPFQPESQKIKPDVNYVSENFDNQMQKVTYHVELWNTMQLESDENNSTDDINSNKNNCRSFENILEALKYIHNNFGANNVDLLITGSLYLIGNTILALEEYDKQLEAH